MAVPRTPPLQTPARLLGRPKAMDPSKAVLAAPRIRPVSTRDYGKGGTPLSGSPDMGLRGASIGYGGFKPYGT
jgi:hypothetical protein